MISRKFRYQTFVAVSGKLGGKVPIVDDPLSSLEQEIYHTTSFDENCPKNEFQRDRAYYVDLRQTYSALKLKFVKVRGYEAYNSKKVKKQKDVANAHGEREEGDEPEAPVPFVVHVNNILHSIFSNEEVYIKNQQI